MTVSGEPLVLADHGAVLAWDGQRLPGPWLTLRAIDEASRRARLHGAGIVSIRRSHHIAALAPYARRVADAGLVLLLLSSAPAAGSVAPFGGTRGLFSPSPIGVGIPTGGDPMMVDVSTSITTNGLTGRLAREGRKLPGPWLIDEHGVATDDPAVLVPPRAGTILPLGGTDAGHKGYGLALMVEALTAGLAGQGRSDPGARWGATVFVQVIDPQAFNGREAFEAQMDWIGRQCETQPAGAARRAGAPAGRARTRTPPASIAVRCSALGRHRRRALAMGGQAGRDDAGRDLVANRVTVSNRMVHPAALSRRIRPRP